MDGFLSTNPQAHRDWGEIEDKASVRFETMGFSCCYVQLGLYILAGMFNSRLGQAQQRKA